MAVQDDSYGYNPLSDAYRDGRIEYGKSSDHDLEKRARQAEVSRERAEQLKIQEMNKRERNYDLNFVREQERIKKAESYSREGVEREINEWQKQKTAQAQEEEHLEAYLAARARYTQKSTFYRMFHKGISMKSGTWQNSANDMSTDELNALYGGNNGKSI